MKVENPQLWYYQWINELQCNSSMFLFWNVVLSGMKRKYQVQYTKYKVNVSNCQRGCWEGVTIPSYRSPCWAAGPCSAPGPAELPSPAPVFRLEWTESFLCCQTGSRPTGTPGDPGPAAARLQTENGPDMWHKEGKGQYNSAEGKQRCTWIKTE